MRDRLEKIRRNFRDINYARALQRAFDNSPLQCSLYVTDRCNLDCGYCDEHDNNAEHPSIFELKRRVCKIQELGTLKIALVGGEPLCHPEIVELVRFCKSLGMSTSLTTNGLLLKEKLVTQLETAGLKVIQISVDRVTPSDVTKKAIELLDRKIALLDHTRIKVHLTGVICADTLDECEPVLDYGLTRGIPTEIRLVHADSRGEQQVDAGERERAQAIIRRMIERKRSGDKIHTTLALLEYQLALLDDQKVREGWTCAAGYKLFFVSARGNFMECSMRPEVCSIFDIDREDLKSFYRKKACQKGCGVYCAVGASLFRERPVKYIVGEVIPRWRQTVNALRG